MKVLTTISLVTLLLLTGCGRPSGLSQEQYEKYKAAEPPKLIYSCTVRHTTKQKKYTVPGEQFDFPKFKKCLDDGFEREYCVEHATTRSVATRFRSFLSRVKALFTKDEVETVRTEVSALVSLSSMVNYNGLVDEAEKDCDGELKILRDER